ncbi:MAG: hypothetical protein OXE95_00230 [Chloroflexi bacterium]|nr:hypothetical protein [Chloroflexota bacterium]MCY4245983.1 hypothetical protein [Chloroflexota bacterium]
MFTDALSTVTKTAGLLAAVMVMLAMIAMPAQARDWDEPSSVTVYAHDEGGWCITTAWDSVLGKKDWAQYGGQWQLEARYRKNGRPVKTTKYYRDNVDNPLALPAYHKMDANGSAWYKRPQVMDWGRLVIRGTNSTNPCNFAGGQSLQVRIWAVNKDADKRIRLVRHKVTIPNS